MGQNKNEKRENKLRNKGRTILDNPNATITLDTTELEASEKIRSIKSKPLKPELRNKAIHLWPFVVACGDELAAESPSAEAWADGFRDLTPEMEIFRWEGFVLAILHAVELLSNGNVSEQGYDEEFCRSARVPTLDMLGKRSLASVRNLDKAFLKMLHNIVFHRMNDVKLPEEGYGAVPARVVGLAVEKVENARKAEYEKLRKLKEIRYGKMLGAACATCKVVSTEHKKCSICRRTYYCGLECQKMDWQEHKKVCHQVSEN